MHRILARSPLKTGKPVDLITTETVQLFFESEYTNGMSYSLAAAATYTLYALCQKRKNSEL
jgi:hypothetical protein